MQGNVFRRYKMSGDIATTEEKVEKQRQERERQKQYDTVTGLGWKGFGIAFLLIIIGVVIYAVFFH